MASPSPNPAAAGGAASAQPPTSPTDGLANASTAANQQPSGSEPAPNQNAGDGAPPQFPSTSLQDDGKTRRPAVLRLMHMLLAAQGVTAYQERVPLQLLDFAYRYTSSTLQDAVYLVTEVYPGDGSGGRGEGGNKVVHHDVNSISLAALRMSIASRLHYQFQPTLPKEFLLEMAAERNRIILPGAVRGVDTGVAPTPSSNSVLMGGIRLPPERFCQTGMGWDLKDEWESEGEEEIPEDEKAVKAEGEAGADKDAGEEEDEDENMEDDEDGRMEDVFGEEPMGEDNEGEGEDEDKTMTGT